jgi:hypothetical protein
LPESEASASQEGMEELHIQIPKKTPQTQRVQIYQEIKISNKQYY